MSYTCTKQINLKYATFAAKMIKKRGKAVELHGFLIFPLLAVGFELPI